MILLSDANVLMDLWHVDAVEILPQIAPCEILHSVLNECDDDEHPGIASRVEKCGIKVIEEDYSLLLSARRKKVKGLSSEDKMNLLYAQENDRILLSGDMPLRKACKAEGVECHGSIWVVEEVVKRGLAEKEDLCRWLHLWQQPAFGRRLPLGEMNRLKEELECVE